MHPRYIRHELETSLRNLGLETIDVYYLHNPESQLQGVARGPFLERMRACFEELERAVGEGLVGAYGTATWDGFRTDPSSAAALSLDELLRAARASGGDGHHFRVIQLPFNLGMPEAFVKPTQIIDQDRVPALEAAARLGLVGVRVWLAAAGTADVAAAGPGRDDPRCSGPTRSGPCSSSGRPRA